MSILSYFKRSATQQQCAPRASVAAAPGGPAAAIGSTDEYIDGIKKDIDADRLDLTGNATVVPPCPFATAKAANDARRRSGASLLLQAAHVCGAYCRSTLSELRKAPTALP